MVRDQATGSQSSVVSAIILPQSNSANIFQFSYHRFFSTASALW